MRNKKEEKPRQEQTAKKFYMTGDIPVSKAIGLMNSSHTVDGLVLDDRVGVYGRNLAGELIPITLAQGVPSITIALRVKAQAMSDGQKAEIWVEGDNKDLRQINMCEAKRMEAQENQLIAKHTNKPSKAKAKKTLLENAGIMRGSDVSSK